MSTIKELATQVHNTALKKGFWDRACNFGEKIALVHSELSEALEAFRCSKPGVPLIPSNKTPAFNAVEEELADAVIRILDLCEYSGFDIEGAILAKMAFNEGRPHLHGKQF